MTGALDWYLTNCWNGSGGTVGNISWLGTFANGSGVRSPFDFMAFLGNAFVRMEWGPPAQYPTSALRGGANGSVDTPAEAAAVWQDMGTNTSDAVFAALSPTDQTYVLGYEPNDPQVDEDVCATSSGAPVACAASTALVDPYTKPAHVCTSAADRQVYTAPSTTTGGLAPFVYQSDPNTPTQDRFSAVPNPLPAGATVNVNRVTRNTNWLVVVTAVPSRGSKVQKRVYRGYLRKSAITGCDATYAVNAVARSWAANATVSTSSKPSNAASSPKTLDADYATIRDELNHAIGYAYKGDTFYPTSTVLGNDQYRGWSGGLDHIIGRVQDCAMNTGKACVRLHLQ